MRTWNGKRDPGRLRGIGKVIRIGTEHLSPRSDDKTAALALQIGHSVRVAAFLIRVANASDFEVISDLYRRSSLSNAGDRDALLANPEALVFERVSISEGRTRVAVDDDRIVGFATMTLDGVTAELDDLFVDPAWMRRGVARALVLDAVSVARAGQSNRIEVTANSHALSFYNAVGFVADGVVTTQFAPGTRMHLNVEP